MICASCIYSVAAVAMIVVFGQMSSFLFLALTVLDRIHVAQIHNQDSVQGTEHVQFSSEKIPIRLNDLYT